MPTDLTESGLERLICESLSGDPCDPASDHPTGKLSESSGGVGWSPGNYRDYDREYCVDLVQLRIFLHTTQPELTSRLHLDEECPTRRKFLARLRKEIDRRGTIDILRKGIKHGSLDLNLFYSTPSAKNETALQYFRQNRFSVTRQLRYSKSEPQRSLDIVLFINGLPVFTFELKNSLTKQTHDDAIWQYKQDRNPSEPLFRLGCCVAHFAVDEHQVYFCTHLRGKESWFLPFNRGSQGGAGNPTNPDGLKTDYLWREVLTRESVSDILENYAQMVESKDAETGNRRKLQIWPRYQQLDVVRQLLEDTRTYGVGKRYLIQHSAGSGKSFSIAWLAHQLIPLERGGKPVFDSIIVVTDRRILDKQIQDTIRQYTQVSATVGHAERSGDLRQFIEQGKKIIISTIQKFPFILNEVVSEQRSRTFAIIIDEAHSSQGGKTSAAVSQALGNTDDSEEMTYEDRINQLMESRKMLPNASYYAFTATPKNKTLEIFGVPESQSDGKVQHRPFHTYSMKQAIQEGFILDVLKYYTPVRSYYRLAKTVEGDPKFDAKKARKKLRHYVEGHEHAIQLKAEIMADHFHEQVVVQRKIDGMARAMVVTNGVERAIQYFYALRDYLQVRKRPYKVLVAFSGERDHGGVRVSEATLNDFPSAKIAEVFRKDPSCRFLVCADKFQTGYDEPLLHTMYVDKTLSGIKAVQTLSRLNRSHRKKHDVFILDFLNDTETIAEAFSEYYRTTILSDETDPNRLHDLQSDLDSIQVYSPGQIGEFVEMYMDGEERDRLDPILDRCVEVYMEDLDEDEQVAFKSKAKAFVRTYAFLSSILPYSNQGWEERSIFLNFLIPKLPAPEEPDLSRGILEMIDMDSYRVEKRAMQKITLEDEDAMIDPVQGQGADGQREVELDTLSKIIEQFNDQFGGIEFEDGDRVLKLITEEIPAKVAADPAFKNAKQNSDRENARVEHDRVLGKIMMNIMKDDTELFRQFVDNEKFKHWLGDIIFGLNYKQENRPLEVAGASLA